MSPTASRLCRLLATATALLLASAIVAGCGEKNEKSANDTDTAFVEAMIPHLALSVSAAQNQSEKGDNAALKGAAAAILNTQMAEISELDRIGKLTDAKVDPKHLSAFSGDYKQDGLDQNAAAALKALGLSPSQAGVDSDPTGALDDEFAEKMIAYGQGTKAIANAELANGENPTLKAIAQRLINSETARVIQLRSAAKTQD